MSLTLTDVPGVLVGHATDRENLTGCTAVLCPGGAVCGVDVRGFAPGSLETPLLDPVNRVEEAHGLLLTGGSAYGLAAAAGVVRRLTEMGCGLDTLYARIPLVPGAVIYDLNFNQSRGPGPDLGYQAAAAASDGPVVQGCVGAGAGATCGKLAGFDRAMKTGLGSAGARTGELVVAALAVVNPLGDVLDPDTGETLAGVRTPDGSALAGALEVLQNLTSLLQTPPPDNTVLGVVATNARLTKVGAARLARMASAGIARAVRPAHLLFDGDVVFSLATGKGPAMDENIVGALGAEALARAIAAGARAAEGVPGYPACRDLR
ncbi:MAG: P1 family peptidase [Thermodesulfobacteriota bacterium]